MLFAIVRQEYFRQALGIPSANKYENPGEHYFANMVQLIRKVSFDPVADQIKFWGFVVFDFLIGNTDAHVKNFSLLHRKGVCSIRLAPAYDMVSMTVYPQSTRNMAFGIARTYNISEIERTVFLQSAKEVGIGTKITMHHFDELAEKFSSVLTCSAEEFAVEGSMRKQMISLEISKKIFATRGIKNLI